jgi:hypothetical protein
MKNILPDITPVVEHAVSKTLTIQHAPDLIEHTTVADISEVNIDFRNVHF